MIKEILSIVRKFYPMSNTFQLFVVQTRIVGALIMREVITRYGRNNIGFLWMFFDPLLTTTIVVGLWYAVRAHEVFSLPMIPFMITGYSLMRMWRTTSSRFIGAINANAGLLYHRNVRLFDVYLARFILDVAGMSIAFILLILLLVYIDLMRIPNDVLYMIFAWGLMAWFAFGLGLVIANLSERFQMFKKIWSNLGIVMMVGSGVFFLADHLPQKVREIALWVPMVHGSEMIRHAYFGDLIRTHENPSYLILWNLFLTFFGLLLLKKQSDEIDFS